MIRHIVIAAAQAIAPVAVIYVAAAIWLLYQHGWAYADSAAFRQTMGADFKYAVAGALLLLLVIICYRVTRRTLDS